MLDPLEDHFGGRFASCAAGDVKAGGMRDAGIAAKQLPSGSTTLGIKNFDPDWIGIPRDFDHEGKKW